MLKKGAVGDSFFLSLFGMILSRCFWCCFLSLYIYFFTLKIDRRNGHFSDFSVSVP